MSKKGKELIEELIKKYNINFGVLEKEQIALAKKLEIKDFVGIFDFRLFAGISNVFIRNKIISAIVVIDENFEIIEEDYFLDKIRFPYLPGFRAYRELPTMVNAYHKIQEKPDVFFIKGHGIAHPRLGLASHFSIVTGLPSIGISEKLLVGKIKEENITQDKKIVGKVFQSKPGSKPLYISPGNKISVETAFELTKKFIRYPHKLPEPLHLAHKFAKKVAREFK